MVKIKIEEVVYALDTQFKKALESTLKKTCPDCNFDSMILFVEFRKELYRQCQSWERVPNSCVQREDY